MQLIDKSFVRPKVILFDVYETLLNMAEVQRLVNSLLKNKQGYVIWFELFMQYCFVDNCISQFNSFESIARATMEMAAKSMRRTVTKEDTNQLVEMLKHLPVHGDVQEGLSLLKDQGFRIAALTNSSGNIIKSRMERTGLISYFEMVFSADEVQKYKPSPEVYQWAAQKLETVPGEILFVSTHAWDIAGAANANLLTAYMNKKNQMLYPLAPSPTIICKDFANLANKLEIG